MPGSGAATLFGGGGANVFDFFASLGGAAVNDVIGDWSAIDNVLLVGYAPGTGTNAVNAAIVLVVRLRSRCPTTPRSPLPASQMLGP